jgi:adenine-specific DNA-methyltransferase
MYTVKIGDGDVHDFIEDIGKIYEFINTELDSKIKLEFIKNCKKKFNMGKNQEFAGYYYKLKNVNKAKGVIYTPCEISRYMIKNLVKPIDVIENPFLKIVDPSCGCGNLIFSCFHYLRNIFVNNLESINKYNNIDLKIEDINKHIVYNNLFGFDIDETAIKILKIDLFNFSGVVSSKNFAVKDFLVECIDEKFDIFIGNPPYIGHKQIDRNYCQNLKGIYGSIYGDKGDVSYCFFKKALDCLKEMGKLGFITSRYFCEAYSGKDLRKFLIENSSIYKIVDFYGIRPFKNVGVDPMIIFLIKRRNFQNNVEIIRPKKNIQMEKKEFYDSLFVKKDGDYRHFFMDQNFMGSSGWIFIDKTERSIIDKIRRKSEHTLEDICESHQGLITGCDRAFIVDESVLRGKNIESALIRPWIKSSCIHRNKVVHSGKFIIYSNFIEDEADYPNSIEYIGSYKKKLLNRRECRRGFRKWYELQWGRKPEIFEGKKIVFPYKSKDNRFAIDEGSYFSADVYSLVLKKDVDMTYSDLLKILNSPLYEFYFKTFGKKLGENLYEYYPNNLMRLKIPLIDFFEVNDVEGYLYRFFELTKEEIKIVRQSYYVDE